MAMGADERTKMKDLLKRLREAKEPLKGNLAVFTDEQGKLLYAGFISEWPKIISTDIEWGAVKEMDTTEPPFAGKRVKFYTMITGH